MSGSVMSIHWGISFYLVSAIWEKGAYLKNVGVILALDQI